jgi:hypothetical protein
MLQTFSSTRFSISFKLPHLTTSHQHEQGGQGDIGHFFGLCIHPKPSSEFQLNQPSSSHSPGLLKKESFSDISRFSQKLKPNTCMF